MKSSKHFVATTVLAAILFLSPLYAQTIELVPVVRKPVSRTISLPGEFQPFLSVALYSRVPGYVETVAVDRGSVVKQGDLLVALNAPEMKAHIAEAESKVQAAEADRLQAEAKLTSMEATLSSLQAKLKSAQTTYDRLKKASETPGVIAGNELDVALQSAEAQRGDIEAQRAGIQAQRSSIEALRNKKVAAEAEASRPCKKWRAT